MKAITSVLSVLWLGFWCLPAFAFDCATATRPPSLRYEGAAKLSADMPPADLLSGEKCPEEREKCSVLRPVKPGMLVDPIMRQGGYVCIQYQDQEADGQYVKLAGWVRSDQLAIECASPKISGEAELPFLLRTGPDVMFLKAEDRSTLQMQVMTNFGFREVFRRVPGTGLGWNLSDTSRSI